MTTAQPEYRAAHAPRTPQAPRARRRTTLPPGPKGHWLTGNLGEMRHDILGFLTRCAREYGDFVPLRFVGTRSVFINHPDYVEEVLTTRNQDYVKGRSLKRTRSFIGNGLVVSEGEFWRRQRRLMQPAFHRERIAAYSQLMVDCALRTLAGWRDGEVRDLHQEMMALTLEIAARTLFDADVRGDVERVAAANAVILEHIQSRLESILFLLPDSVPTPSNRRYWRAVRQLDAIVYRLIEERRRAAGQDGSSSGLEGTLLSLLLQAQDEDGSRMTDQQLRDEVLTLFLAGHETTALTLSWACALLAQHPDAAARLAAEVDEVLDNRPPAAADVPRLKYTGMVIAESLRLYPPAAALTREAQRDTQIGGYLVPRGTQVLMSQWVLHRDPRYFDAPESFWPERWEERDGQDLARRLPHYAYFPFGGGQRICIGAGFATMEAVLLLATMAQQFRLTLAPGAVVTPRLSFTLRPAHGVPMTLHRRAATPASPSDPAPSATQGVALGLEAGRTIGR